MSSLDKPVYVLGTGLSHDGSACLLKNGRIAVAIEKERLTRVKHDGWNDTAAIRYCLDAAGIGLGDVELIVQNANFGMFERGNAWYRGQRLIEDGMPVVTISHHLAHAYSAFGCCPFEESSVLVIDGCGNGFDECIDLEGALIPEAPNAELSSLFFEKDSYYRFGPGFCRSLWKDFSPWGRGIRECPMYPTTTRHSIGGLYAAASTYVFGGTDDSGKLMGLAPYGRAGVYDFEIFELRNERVFVRYDWMDLFRTPFRGQNEFRANFQHYADFAWWVQREVERALLFLLQSRYEAFPSMNLCYSGGVALNAVANRRLLNEGPFRKVFIQPAAGDNGLALGAAYYGWLEVLKQERVLHNGSTRFGKIYSTSAVDSALSRFGKSIRVTRTDHFVAETVEHLVNGKVVGWFQGQSEFGPRALGGRSILADPRSSTVRDYINSRIKFREDFRPFAPSVLVEDLPKYFDCDYESPFMLLVAPVRQEWAQAIPGVVHRDGTARIHTVTPAPFCPYYNLLRAFKERSGIGILLNTSLNKRSMPIVESPEHAIQFFLTGGLDLLVIDNYLVQKEGSSDTVPPPVSELFCATIRRALERRKAEGQTLSGRYQFKISVNQDWTVDLSSSAPNITQNAADGPHAVIEMSEDALRSMLESSFEAFRFRSDSRLRISGNVQRALDLFRWLTGS